MIPYSDTEPDTSSPSGWVMVCPECAERIPVSERKDFESFTGAEYVKHYQHRHTPHDSFAIDVDEFDAWLLGKIEVGDVDATPATAVLRDFAEENLGAHVDDFAAALIEEGGIVVADGWTLAVYPIDTADGWEYLLTVRPDMEHHGQFIQVTGLRDELRGDVPLRDLFEKLVGDANRLLPGARAALDAMNTVETPALVAVLNDDGELACPECGNTMFAYEENTIEYRYPGGQDTAAKTVSVVWTAEASADSGDSDPGLFCDTYRSKGCGKPIDLPDGWEISYG